MRRLLLLFAFFSPSALAQSPDWLLASESGRAQAGAPFELLLAGPEGAALPDEIGVRLRSGVAEADVRLQAAGPTEKGRRRHAGVLPPSASGAVAIRVADPPSNVVVLIVERRDAVQSPTGALEGGQEQPLSENEPMYFVIGASSHWSARFQLSFKYRLFDNDAGFGRDQPWLSGLYFATTQTLALGSRKRVEAVLRYELPAVALLALAAHRQSHLDRRRAVGPRARVERPERTRVPLAQHRLHPAGVALEDCSLGTYEFTPKAYVYLDKSDNPDIEQYRGYVDWRARWDSGDNWIITALGRLGTAGKGSIQVDLARRARDLKIGPVSGYFYVQYFNGYGESLRDYDKRHTAQLRFGLAIIP